MQSKVEQTEKSKCSLITAHLGVELRTTRGDFDQIHNFRRVWFGVCGLECGQSVVLNLYVCSDINYKH